MQVHVADDIGFCYGVRRAVEMAEEAAGATGGRVSCLGPLIHNPQEIERLRAKGVKPVGDMDECDGVLVMRAHGVPREEMLEAARRGLTVVDATCPHVRAAQRAAESLAGRGFRVVVVGNPDHPEVRATNSYAGNDCVIVEEPRDVAGVGRMGRVGVVAQTTMRRDLFNSVVESLRSIVDELEVVDTICDATSRRQEATRRLAAECDLVLVIGGRNSANTRRLAEIVREEGCEAHLVETAREVKPEWLRGKGSVGVAAGTSTPDWIIKEVVGMVEDMEKAVNLEGEPEEKMAEEPGQVQEAGAACTETDVAGAAVGDAVEVTEAGGSAAPSPEPEMPAASAESQDNEMYDQSLKALKEGDVVPGKVVSVDENGIMVDVGYKSEGFVPANEVARKQIPPTEAVKPGDDIMVWVLGFDTQEGVLKLSKRRADEEVAWQSLEETLQNGGVIEAEVMQEVKGGLVVDVGVRGFVPASQIERGYVSNLAKYVGQTLRLKILELDRSKNRVVLSQRVVLEEERERLKAETWAGVAEGQVRHGIVKGITDFGAFVDIGGVDGLLHVSELSWGRVNHPSEVVKEGDEIDVMILRIDREKGKISLGLKQVMPDPWTAVPTKYPVDSIVEGKVTRLAPFGAFVQLEPGVEGLIHISELSHERVSKPDEVLSPGQTVRVKVLKSRPEERRISLSLKAVEDAREQEKVEDYLAEQKSPDQVTLGEVFGEILDEAKNGSRS